MTQNIPLNTGTDADDLVEVAVPEPSLAPAYIADAGLVHQGGLRRLMPWLFGG